MDPQHPGKEAGLAGTLQEEVRGLEQRKDRTQGGRGLARLLLPQTLSLKPEFSGGL